MVEFDLTIHVVPIDTSMSYRLDERTCSMQIQFASSIHQCGQRMLVVDNRKLYYPMSPHAHVLSQPSREWLYIIFISYIIYDISILVHIHEWRIRIRETTWNSVPEMLLLLLQLDGSMFAARTHLRVLAGSISKLEIENLILLFLPSSGDSQNFIIRIVS